MSPSNRPVTLKDLRAGGDGSGSGSGSGSGNDSDSPAVGAARTARVIQPSSSKSFLLPFQKYASNNNSSNNNNNNSSNFVPPTVHHIPCLPKAEEAKAMLERVVREYLPIIQRRGYNVESISELCCCNDGLDFAAATTTTTTGNDNHQKQRRRKLRKVANNIWGYNRITTTIRRFGPSKSHTIHLRLRHVSAHTTRMHCYEDVAGTLAHELAHCEYRAHNKNFYELMDDILDEHASLLASGLTMGGGSFPMFAFGGEGRVLGGGGGSGRGHADQKREQGAWLQAMEPGRVLGGNGNFQRWMTAREASVAAAMARHQQQQLRLRGNQCCRPCHVTSDGDDDEDDEVEIIETDPKQFTANNTNAASLARQLKVDDKDDKDDAKKPASRNKRRHPVDEILDTQQQQSQITVNHKKRAPRKAGNEVSIPKGAAAATVIDLTELDHEDDEKQQAQPQQQKQPPMSFPWSCSRCTFLNPPLPSLSLITQGVYCELCLHPC